MAPSEADRPDERATGGRARRFFARAVGWLRDFHRGYSRTGHLSYRKK